jgi:pimeloyl-ACP methyl ester carboxylesterase
MATRRYRRSSGELDASLDLIRCQFRSRRLVDHPLLADAFTTPIEQPAVFIFPGLGGDVRELAALRRGCASSLQCIAVQFPYWTDHARALTLDQVVDYCVVQIESSAPTGNLRLAGYSFGGTIAYAVAEALTAAGRRVERLGLVDAPSSSHVSTSSPKARWRRWATAIRDRQLSQEIARTIVGSVMRLNKPRLLIALGRNRRFKLPFDMQEHLNGHITCRLRQHLLLDLIEQMGARKPRLDVPNSLKLMRPRIWAG